MTYILIAFVIGVFLARIIYGIKTIRHAVKALTQEADEATSDLTDLLKATEEINIVPINKTIGQVSRDLIMVTDAYSDELIEAREQTKNLIGQALIARQQYQVCVQDRIRRLKPIIETLRQMKLRINQIKLPTSNNLKRLETELDLALGIRKTMQNELKTLSATYQETVKSVAAITDRLEVEGNKLNSTAFDKGLGTRLKEQFKLS